MKRMSFSFLLTLLALCQSTTAEEMHITHTSAKKVLVKEGQSTTMNCATDQEWFFCLWRSPSGIKECLIQENETFLSACTGVESLEVEGGATSCSLSVRNVQVEDQGTYMCLLSQEDIFDTARAYFHLQVATPAEVKIVVKNKQEIGTMELTEQHVTPNMLNLTNGELVELSCEAERAFPVPEFTWTIPGKQSISGMKVSTLEKEHFHLLIPDISD